MLDSLNRSIAGAMSILAPGVLRAGLEELQVILDDVLDAEEDVAKPGLTHQRSERVAMVCNGRGHRLDGVIYVIEPGIDYRPAEAFEPPDIEGNIVVDDKDRSRSVIMGIPDIGYHPVERIGMKIPASHLDYRAKAAVKGTPSRGLDDIDLPSHYRITVQHAGGSIRK